MKQSLINTLKILPKKRVTILNQMIKILFFFEEKMGVTRISFLNYQLVKLRDGSESKNINCTKNSLFDINFLSVNTYTQVLNYYQNIPFLIILFI